MGTFYPRNDYRMFLIEQRSSLARQSYLAHHGVKGQKWGVKNGPPYPIGSSLRKVFISGTSKIKLKGSEYYRKSLPKEITSKIDSYMKDNNHILIGDAPGIDTEVQKYLAKKGYRNVTVYTISKDKPRSYWDDGHLGWGIKNVEGTEQVDKDKAMSKDAHTGFAVILEDGAKATRNNVDRMRKDDKDVEVFTLSKDGNDHWVYTAKYNIPTDRPHNDYNIDSWGSDTDHNILWITGFSGSGKSTIAKKMAKENGADYIELDSYVGGMSTKGQDKSFNKYLDSKYPNWKSDYRQCFDTHKNMGKYFDKFEKCLIDYSKEHKIVAEGIQIMDETLFYNNKNSLKDKPIIVMNTPITDAYLSAIRRDQISVEDAMDSERIDWYGSMFNDMVYLNNLLNTPIKDTK